MQAGSETRGTFVAPALKQEELLSTGLFYPQVKGFFEMLFGPLGPQPLSSLIYGTYTGLIYATPLLGGWR